MAATAGLNPVGAPDEIRELKTSISDALSSKGVLAKMKAQLRAAVYTIIEEQEGGDSVFLNNPKAGELSGNPKSKFVSELIKEFLNFYELDYSATTFASEAKLDGSNKSRDQLRSQAGLGSDVPPSQRVPLLVEIVSAFTDGSRAQGSAPPAESSNSQVSTGPQATGPSKQGGLPTLLRPTEHLSLSPPKSLDGMSPTRAQGEVGHVQNSNMERATSAGGGQRGDTTGESAAVASTKPFVAGRAGSGATNLSSGLDGSYDDTFDEDESVDAGNSSVDQAPSPSKPDFPASPPKKTGGPLAGLPPLTGIQKAPAGAMGSGMDDSLVSGSGHDGSTTDEEMQRLKVIEEKLMKFEGGSLKPEPADAAVRSSQEKEELVLGQQGDIDEVIEDDDDIEEEILYDDDGFEDDFDDDDDGVGAGSADLSMNKRKNLSGGGDDSGSGVQMSFDRSADSFALEEFADHVELAEEP